MIALLDLQQPPTFKHVVAVHKAEPLLQVIDTIPLLLALTFGLLGRAMARLDHFIENLEGTVVQRDLVLKRAQSQADAARKAKGALLSQFVERMHEQFSKGEPSLNNLLNAGLPLEVQRSLKAVSGANHRVKALLWDLEMLANVEDDAAEPSDGELCRPKSLCQETLEAFSQRFSGQFRYKVMCGPGVPTQIQVSKDRVARTLTSLLQCATQGGGQQNLEVTLSHFAASHGGNSQVQVTIRNPRTPTTNSVVRCFSDLDPNAQGGKQHALELQLALCRQLGMTHKADVGVRADPRGGMSYWLIFPYYTDENSREQATEQTNTDSQEMVETQVA